MRFEQAFGLRLRQHQSIGIGAVDRGEADAGDLPVARNHIGGVDLVARDFMPKISNERRAERRATILAAARACFEMNGLHAATMDDIVRRSVYRQARSTAIFRP